MSKRRVFISYSHQDKVYVEELRKNLKPLEAQGLLTMWDDTQIPAGAQWRMEINAQLSVSSFGVLLISPDFLASNFIVREEVPPLLAAEAAGKLKLLIIFARPSLVQYVKFDYPDPVAGVVKKALTEFQGLNSPDSPLSSFEGGSASQEYTRVAEKLLKAVL